MTGDWKTIVGLQRGDEVMAVLVYLPADPEINAPAIAALPERHATFVRNTALLLREQHAGPTWPAVAGYSGPAVRVALWAGLIAFVAHRLSGTGAEPVVPVQPTSTRISGAAGSAPQPH